jgi:methylthioribose-1-phosphate isomerase
MSALLSVQWVGDLSGCVRLIDQTLLPTALQYRDCHTIEEIWEAIRSLRVRGAPAIGVTAAMGVVLGVRLCQSSSEWNERLRDACAYLRTSRPTAVNLFWALERMEETGRSLVQDDRIEKRSDRLLNEALKIQEQDRQMCAAIGTAGAALIRNNTGVLTHCNTGALATAGSGTALAVLAAAAEQGRQFEVFADETRPLLQGARLTAWELQQLNIPATVICDSMAAQVMKEGRIQLVIVGADRIAANGDTANKIGTYGVAVLSRAHNIPLYVAAPTSTFDLSLASGQGIPIEKRDPREITHGFGKQTVPDGMKVYNPAFDVTPASLITGIITERGVVEPVNETTIRQKIGPGRVLETGKIP